MMMRLPVDLEEFVQLAGLPNVPSASAAAAPVSGHAGGAAVAEVVLDATPVVQDEAAALQSTLRPGCAVANAPRSALLVSYDKHGSAACGRARHPAFSPLPFRSLYAAGGLPAGVLS